MRELEQIFKGLADITRLRILNLLLRGELCVCDIQYVLDSPQPNVSRHLTYLKNAGLVLDRREAVRIYYRLAQPKEGVHKHLFSFLREAFEDADLLRQDLRKLSRAIGQDACRLSQGRLVRVTASQSVLGRQVQHTGSKSARSSQAGP